MSNFEMTSSRIFGATVVLLREWGDSSAVVLYLQALQQLPSFRNGRKKLSRRFSPSSPRASVSTAEQSATDFRGDQNGSVTHRSHRPAGTQSGADSTDVLVSQSANGEPTVTVQESRADSAGAAPRRTVTIKRDGSQPHPLPAPSQNVSGSPQTGSAPEKHGFQRMKYTYLGILRCWCMELIAILLAMIIVVVIVVLLHYYHDRDVRSWDHNWAINSVFAFLTAIMEASVAFAVSSALGQLRWLWYTNDNNQHTELKWMDRLTNARSAPGAFRFAFGNLKTAIRHWAFLGAALIVCLLGVGVFTQNVITVRGQERDVPGVSQAKSPISKLYEGQWQLGASGYTPGDQMPYVWMISAIDAGFLYPVNDQNSDNVISLVTCPTGNCTFGLYSTLSLCTQCANITEHLLCGDVYQHPDTCPKGARTRLPDDSISLDPFTGVVNITSDGSYPKYSNMTGIGPLVARYLGLGYWNKPAYATECALYWCVNTYNATVVSNLFNEMPTNSWTNMSAPQTQYNQSWHIDLNPDECHKDGKASSDCVFGVDPISQLALQNYLINGSTSTNTTGFLRGSAYIPEGGDGQQWFVRGLAANAIIAPCSQNGTCTEEKFYKVFDQSFASMAYFMSNNIRESTAGYSYGTMTRFDTYFHVRWGWLAYPIAVVLIALIFLLVTMYKSRGTEPWKSSVTALLFHGLTDEDRESYLRLNDPIEMKKAENWVVTLQDNKGTRSFRVKTRGLPGFDGKEHGGGPTAEGMANVGIAMLEALDQK